jgi:Uma2 family endonuclease
MREWVANGARLAWLIDPDRRAIEIYRPNADPEIRINIDSIAGEGPIDGFILNLVPVWNPLPF